MKTTHKKVQNLLILMEKLARGEELYPQNTRIQEELEVDERTLRRYLEDIHDLYGHVVLTQKTKTERGGRPVTVYRVAERQKDVAEVFRFFIESSDDLGWLLQLVYENDPTLLNDYRGEARRHLHKVLQKEAGIFQFVGSPFENLDDPRLAAIFKTLRDAVREREYRAIDYHYRTKEHLAEVKCLKLLHMQGNWYLAAEVEGNVRLLRLAFIEKVGYAKKSNYRPDVLDKYAPYFERIQNAMTLNAPFETARLLASPEVAIYFEEGMKPFFPSQRFVRRHDDGSVEFSVRYTQPMEILPFIKQWLPDIAILEPTELKEAYDTDLRRALAP